MAIRRLILLCGSVLLIATCARAPAGGNNNEHDATVTADASSVDAAGLDARALPGPELVGDFSSVVGECRGGTMTLQVIGGHRTGAYEASGGTFTLEGVTSVTR